MRKHGWRTPEWKLIVARSTRSVSRRPFSQDCGPVVVQQHLHESWVTMPYAPAMAIVFREFVIHFIGHWVFDIYN